ncbi:hypothetical protein WA171_000474 [Blastocystis sp. BT1]
MHPDCFSLNKENDVTVRDVLDAFPLSRFGRYHLRFRKNTDDSYQWIEPQEVDGPCPIYNGVIFLKVLNLDKMGLSTQRISIEDSIPYEEETDTVDFISDDVEVEFSDTFQDSYNESESSSVPNVRSDTSDIPLHSEQSPTTPNDSVFTFVSVESDDLRPQYVNDKPEPLAKPAFSAPPIIEEAPVNLKYVTKKDIQLDEEASKLTATSYEGKSETVVAAMKAREEQLRERQIKALMEKKEREIASEVKEEERDAAKAKYGKQLNAWAYDMGGERKNIRTLLSTMHTVMWSEAEFKPISMAQLLDPDKVKLYYRKAMLVDSKSQIDL